MTYLVTDNCVKCKYMDCVEVCPVDCFYEGENMLVIDPEECIDCTLCEPECPANAIISEDDLKENVLNFWKEINTEYSKKWPNITSLRKEDVPNDADEWNGVKDKFKDHFSSNAGKGD